MLSARRASIYSAHLAARAARLRVGRDDQLGDLVEDVSSRAERNLPAASAAGFVACACAGAAAIAAAAAPAVTASACRRVISSAPLTARPF